MLSSSCSDGLPKQASCSDVGSGALHQSASWAGERVRGEERVTDGKAGDVHGSLVCTKNAGGKTLNVDPSGHGRIHDFPTGKTDQWFQRKVSTDVTGKMEAHTLTLGKSKYTHN